jgi:hypothetical protein
MIQVPQTSEGLGFTLPIKSLTWPAWSDSAFSSTISSDPLQQSIPVSVVKLRARESEAGE